MYDMLVYIVETVNVFRSFMPSAIKHFFLRNKSSLRLMVYLRSLITFLNTFPLYAVHYFLLRRLMETRLTLGIKKYEI